MFLPGQGGLTGGTVLPSGNPLDVLQQDHHVVKRRVLASGEENWQINRDRECSSAIAGRSSTREKLGQKNNAKVGCTEPMVHNGSTVQLHPRKEKNEEKKTVKATTLPGTAVCVKQTCCCRLLLT